MTRDELIEALRRQEGLFRREKVRQVSLFGSQARGEARPDSDVDLLIDYEPDARITLVDFCRLQLDLAECLGKTVQLVRSPIRRERFRKAVEEDALAVL